MLRKMDHSLKLSGTGETKESAFNNIFSQIKPLVAQTFPNCIVIQIEPKDIEMLSATEATYTERFFGLLFPRKRTRYDITVIITVHLRFIESSEIPFITKEEDLSPAQRVLKMR